jgi:hypothetical protein
MSYPNCGSKKLWVCLQDHKSDKLSELWAEQKEEAGVCRYGYKGCFFFFYVDTGSGPFYSLNYRNVLLFSRFHFCLRAMILHA